MSERQMSMMCTKDICNNIVSSDFKGPQVLCYESTPPYALESISKVGKVIVDME